MIAALRDFAGLRSEEEVEAKARHEAKQKVMKAHVRGSRPLKETMREAREAGNQAAAEAGIQLRESQATALEKLLDLLDNLDVKLPLTVPQLLTALVRTWVFTSPFLRGLASEMKRNARVALEALIEELRHAS